MECRAHVQQKRAEEFIPLDFVSVFESCCEGMKCACRVYQQGFLSVDGHQQECVMRVVILLCWGACKL